MSVQSLPKSSCGRRTFGELAVSEAEQIPSGRTRHKSAPGFTDKVKAEVDFGTQGGAELYLPNCFVIE